MAPDLDSLDSVLTALAVDSVRMQMLFDARHAQELKSQGPALQRLLAMDLDGIAPGLIKELVQAALPPRLQVVSHTIDFRCELSARREVHSALRARPLNLSYEAQFGSTETWAAHFRLEVGQESLPSTGNHPLSVLNHSTPINRHG
jgi:hypothetical protein